MVEKHIFINHEEVKARKTYYFFKRVMDVVIAIGALFFLSPLMIYIAFKIKRDDGGTILYKQIRIGKEGHFFEMYKFRSMVENADQLLEKLKGKNEIDGAMFKIKDDPRITNIGHFLRKHSLDELPQLFNVLKGDMSLVGPRPSLPSEVEQYTKYDKQRLYVIPGCTGLWQATKRNSVGFNEMVELDLRYIQLASIRYDLYIILKTVIIMIRPNYSY